MPTVTRQPEHPGYETLGSENTKGEDYLLLVDGHEIGGTYYCDATDIRDGEHWASWGPPACPWVTAPARTPNRSRSTHTSPTRPPPSQPLPNASPPPTCRRSP